MMWRKTAFMTALVCSHQQALSETDIILACLALLVWSCYMIMPAADSGMGNAGLEERRSSSAGASSSQDPGPELAYPAHRWGRCSYHDQQLSHHMAPAVTAQWLLVMPLQPAWSACLSRPAQSATGWAARQMLYMPILDEALAAWPC